MSAGTSDRSSAIFTARICRTPIESSSRGPSIESRPLATLSQIAFSVTDLRLSHRWYRDAFGYLPAGGTYTFRGRTTEQVQGVPGAASSCWWLNDCQDFFQLELFEFHRPEARPLPKDWRPCDVGYTTVGVHVESFDRTLERLRACGTSPLTEPVGDRGARRVCVRDPDGVLIEVMEDDPRGSNRRARPHGEVPVATRFVTLSVPDLERARHTWLDTLGLAAAPDLRLHGPEHEALWGLAGASRDSFVAWADDFLVEVVQYQDPAGKPWPPGYRISDRGLLNVALGFRDREAFRAALARCEQAGLRPNRRPFSFLGLWEVVYVNDPLGFSIELLYVSRPGRTLPVRINEVEIGFAPKHEPARRLAIARRMRPR
jgi:catechol 2,3-dioxygenase-like lactoylglutathione lyase family enzyme